LRIGTRLLPRPEAATAGVAEPAVLAEPGADGTLLAIVPIPGTGTSLAIVGYPVSDEILPSRDDGGGRPAVGDEARPPATGLQLDHEQRQVWADGKEISLTYQEFELLAFLAAHPATVFSRSELVARVWQRDFTADSRTVDVHVSRLRQKLGQRYGRCLVTEYRVGYQFRSVPPRP
jgi:Transcriptional regulatory protein, C terminal